MSQRVLLSLAGVSVVFALGSGQTIQAQAAQQAAPAPAPSTTPVPALPAYGQQPGRDQSIPAATSAAPPVVAPTQVSPQTPVQAYIPYGIPDEDRKKRAYGSVYIPLDSWVYPAMTRLYSLGYADTMYLSMRPYTRGMVAKILDETAYDVEQSDSDEAKEIFVKLQEYVRDEPVDGVTPRGTVYGVEALYGRAMGISGQTLRDSYHLGQTIVNDYGRPYEPGFNALAGYSALTESGRFSLYVRGEYQHAPSAAGYSQTLSTALSQGGNAANPFQLNDGDGIPFSGNNLHQDTIPTGPIPSVNPFRLQEATLSFHLLGHEISGGKSDAWLGPAQGGAMAWTNNAEDIYSFRINRVEPLYIPLVSYLLGTFRYDFFYGSLKGHTFPNSPYVHSIAVSFRPTVNAEITFQRTVIFGGEGHEPVTLHTFLKSFFDINDTTGAEKYSRNDPGARFSDFSFSWRLPFVRRYATLVLDSIAHDDVSPITAPRRAAYRTGVYLSQIPGMRKLDFRAEAVTTDPGVTRSMGGQFNYFETIQRQGYTNKGFIMGDWIGREAKGGQAWLTYHLSGDEYVQVEYLNKKTPKDFIPGVYDAATNTYGPGGTTQNQFKVNAVKRFAHDSIEVNAWFQHEGWKAPIYLPGLQTNNVFAGQVTFFPAVKTALTLPWKR